MANKIVFAATKGLEGLTSVRFLMGFLTGVGTVAIILANAVGLI